MFLTHTMKDVCGKKGPIPTDFDKYIFTTGSSR
jgi:hypothetical protein